MEKVKLIDIILDLLKDGPVSTRQFYAHFAALGHPETNIRRGVDRLRRAGRMKSITGTAGLLHYEKCVMKKVETSESTELAKEAARRNVGNIFKDENVSWNEAINRIQKIVGCNWQRGSYAMKYLINNGFVVATGEGHVRDRLYSTPKVSVKPWLLSPYCNTPMAYTAAI